jgi:hypothetical protein
MNEASSASGPKDRADRPESAGLAGVWLVRSDGQGNGDDASIAPSRRAATP